MGADLLGDAMKPVVTQTTLALIEFIFFIAFTFLFIEADRDICFANLITLCFWVASVMSVSGFIFIVLT